MKGYTKILLLLSTFLTLAKGVKVKKLVSTGRVADRQFLQRQLNIYDLFRHARGPNVDVKLENISNTWKIEEHLADFTNDAAVQEFLHLCGDGLLPRGHIFSIFQDQHREQAVSLFHIFYYAKDWKTFYNTALWAREVINEDIFVYALTVAIIHRADAQEIILPPPYEIHPYYYTNNNNSGLYQRFNIEEKLSYFTEDIGLNAYYFYFHADYPFWLGGEPFNLHRDRRGELYYYMHQQLLSRHYLERLSNGLGEIPDISWRLPIDTGYFPHLRYENGLEFPSRPNHLDLRYPQNQILLQQVEDYERRIRDVVDQGYVVLLDILNEDGIDILGRLIENNPDSNNKRFYKHLEGVTRRLLSNWVKHHHPYYIVPSALEHYHTSLRDPLFYQLFKRILGHFVRWQEHLQPYTTKELSYSGVQINSVSVDRLVTYMDYFVRDMTDPKIRQERLNHKPFLVKIEVTSEEEEKAVVRLYLGPKCNGAGDIIPLAENRLNFVELDQFPYDLVVGTNIIQRDSGESVWNIGDWTPSSLIYNKVQSALSGSEKYEIDNSEIHNGWPDRLLLPRGTRAGVPYQLVVVITPYRAPKVPQGTGYDSLVSTGLGSGARYLESLPFGYPFNRPVIEQHFNVPNIAFKDVVVYHINDVNNSH